MILSPQAKVNMYFYIGFIIVIIALIAYIIFRNPTVVISSDDKLTKDSIHLLHEQIKYSQDKVKQLQLKYDSISSLEPKIEHRTDEKIKFIFNTNDPDTLRNIIKSNWKTKFRHN